MRADLIRSLGLALRLENFCLGIGLRLKRYASI